MSSEIKSSFKLQRIKLFAKLNLLQAVPHNVRNCCSEPLFESEIELLDSCFSDVHKLEVVENHQSIASLDSSHTKKIFTMMNLIRQLTTAQNPNSRKLCQGAPYVTLLLNCSTLVCFCSTIISLYLISRVSRK